MLALTGYRATAQTKPEPAPPQKKQSKSQQNLKPLPRSDNDRELVEEGPEFLKRRQDWFFKPRAFPLGFIPQGARERALQQKKLMYQREGRFNLMAAPGGAGFAIPPTGTSSAWFSIGPKATSTPIFAPFTSGRVTALVVNPNNKDNVYLGGADGGLWVTTDGGTNWSALAATENPPNTGLPSIAVGSLAIDPATCSVTICTTVYVGTGEGNFGGENIYGEGVLKCAVTAGPPPTAICTQDSTFHAISPLTSTRGGPSIGALAVNRLAGKNNILLAGVRGLGTTSIPSGIWCSADNGATWSRVLPTGALTITDPGTDVAFASDGTAWVALGNPFGDAANNGIYKSNAVVSSCAITFAKQVLPAALSTNIGRITLALAPSSDATLYTAIADSATTSSTLLGFAVTTNGGTSWTQRNGDTRLSTSGVCNGQCFYDIPLAVSPASASDVFFGGAARNGTLIRSTDAGITWTEISRVANPLPSDSIHVDMHAIAFSKDGSRMYVGNDGGVWRTDNPTGAPNAGFWTNLNQNLDITQFYPGVSIHPANAGFSMGGTQDNDVQIYQGFNGTPLAWQSAQIGCDGGFTAIDVNIPSTSFGECEYIPNRPPFPIILTTFNGDGILGNGFLANSGIDGTDRGSFIPPLVMDPNTPTTLYFGTCRVWASADGANSWNAISPDVTAAAHPAGCAGNAGGVLSTIAAAPGNSNTIYVGSDLGEVEVTSGGGATWTSIVTATLPTRAVTQVAVDPSTPTTAYVTFSGFGTCANVAITCDGKGHVFMTTNGTAGAATTWTDISIAPFSTTALPDIPVNAIVIDPADATHKTLYVGTDIGGFFTIDGGKNWSPLGAASSLPNAQILGLALHNASRTLRAATHGRGVWDLNLGAAAFSTTSISPFAANAGAASIAPFTVNGSGFTATSIVKFAVNGTTTSLATSCPTATSCTATIPATQLVNGGAASVTVTNTAPAGTTNAVPFTILNPIPVINTISPTTIATGTTNFSLTVNGSSIVCGTNGTVVAFNLSIRTNITACSATSLTVKLPDSDLATPAPAPGVPIDLFTPQPGGGPDTNANPPGLTVTGTGTQGTFTVSGTLATVTAGSSGSSKITVTPSGTFSSALQVPVTCPAAGVPPGVTCTPLTITIPAGTTGTPGPAVTGTLTVNVAGPSTTLTASAAPAEHQLYAAGLIASAGGKGWWILSAGSGFSAMFLLILPGRKKYRAALGLGLVCVLSFTLGCGSYGGGTVPVTTATTTKITVAAPAKVAFNTPQNNFAFTVNVTGGNPTGQVQLYDGVVDANHLRGGPVTLTGGSTIINSAGLAVGTHSIIAGYLGAQYSLASQSGALNVTVTGGPVSMAIATAPAASNASPAINITIQ